MAIKKLEFINAKALASFHQGKSTETKRNCWFWLKDSSRCQFAACSLWSKNIDKNVNNFLIAGHGHGHSHGGHSHAHQHIPNHEDINDNQFNERHITITPPLPSSHSKGLCNSTKNCSCIGLYFLLILLIQKH